jgi:hypothetical protein
LLVDVFADKTTQLPVVQESYYWIYDPTLNLLVLFPKFEINAVSEKSLWLKIIEFCQLSQWLTWFTHPMNLDFKSGQFIFNDDSISCLCTRFNPKYVWSFGQKPKMENTLNCKFLHTQHPSLWLQHPLIKKQIWLTWVSIQQGLV